MILRRASMGMAIALLGGCTFVIDEVGPTAGDSEGDATHRRAVPTPPASEPQHVEPVVLLAAGAHHVCALSLGGEVSCWGRNTDGQLGYGHTEAIGDDELAGSNGSVMLDGQVRSLSAGGRHTCALMTSGAIRCWGYGGDMALGRGHAHDETIGDDETPDSVGPAIIFGASPRRLVAGETHSCRLGESGLVKCWGTSLDGALGYGTSTENAGWLGEVPVGEKAADLVAGYNHTCALLDGGLARCWGNATALGLGGLENIGDDELPSTVGHVPLGEPVVQLAAGRRHTCALTTQGAVRCWGDAPHGALGYPGITASLDAAVGPVDVGAEVAQIAAGREHTCALTTQGRVRCWGAGARGALGYGTTYDVGDDEPPASLGDVDLAEKAVQVAAGDSFTCALLQSGRVSCWGSGGDGEIGYGATSNIGDDELPRDVRPLEPFRR